MKKRFVLICIFIATILIMMGRCSYFSGGYAPVPHWWDEASALVIEHEDLLTAAILEIEHIREDGDISHISFSREGACPSVLGSETLLSVMEIEGIRSVSANENTVTFSIGGRGIGPATSYFGFYYLIDGDAGYHNPWGGGRMDEGYTALRGESVRRSENLELTQYGETWIWREIIGDNVFYIERIVGNFFYYELHF